MGKTTILMVLGLVLLVGGIFSVTARRETEAIESVAELHCSQQARQTANSLAQEGIGIIRRAVNDEVEPKNIKGRPPAIVISFNDSVEGEEYFRIISTARVSDYTFQTEVEVPFSPGTPDKFQPADEQQFFVLRNDRIDFITPQSFESSNFQHSHNTLTYEKLENNYSQMFYHRQPMRFAVANNTVITGNFIIFCEQDIYLNGTVKTAPGSSITFVSKTAIRGGKKVDNGMSTPDTGAVVLPNNNIRLYAPILDRDTGNAYIWSDKQNGTRISASNHFNIYSTNVPSHYTDMERPGMHEEGEEEFLGDPRNWQSRQIANN